MKNKIIYLLSYSRLAYDNSCNIIKYDLQAKKKLESNKRKFDELNYLKFSGYLYCFFDWSGKEDELVLYYKDNWLHAIYRDEEVVVKDVVVNKCFFWKKIFINNNVKIKVYSPFKTLFLVTDQFPDAVEPIYDKFRDLSVSNGISDQIVFFKKILKDE